MRYSLPQDKDVGVEVHDLLVEQQLIESTVACLPRAYQSSTFFRYENVSFLPTLADGLKL